MMPKSELPHDLDPDELNAMVRDLGREKGLPVGIHPDLIGPDEDNHDYWGYGQQERHKQSVEWRRKLIRELMRPPRMDRRMARSRGARPPGPRAMRGEELYLPAVGMPAVAGARWRGATAAARHGSDVG
jgi:hypothetical protein